MSLDDFLVLPMDHTVVEEDGVLGVGRANGGEVPIRRMRGGNARRERLKGMSWRARGGRVEGAWMSPVIVGKRSPIQECNSDTPEVVVAT